MSPLPSSAAPSLTYTPIPMSVPSLLQGPDPQPLSRHRPKGRINQTFQDNAGGYCLPKSLPCPMLTTVYLESVTNYINAIPSSYLTLDGYKLRNVCASTRPTNITHLGQNRSSALQEISSPFINTFIVIRAGCPWRALCSARNLGAPRYPGHLILVKQKFIQVSVFCSPISTFQPILRIK